MRSPKIEGKILGISVGRGLEWELRAMCSPSTFFIPCTLISHLKKNNNSFLFYGEFLG